LVAVAQLVLVAPAAVEQEVELLLELQEHPTQAEEEVVLGATAQPQPAEMVVRA
jgi:hypothetical protein